MAQSPDRRSATIAFESYPVGNPSKKEEFERRMAPLVLRRIARKLRERYGRYTTLSSDSQKCTNDLSRAGTIGTLHAPAGLLDAIASDATLRKYRLFSIYIKPDQRN